MHFNLLKYIFKIERKQELYKYKYRKTLCPVPPLNDRYPFNFERGTGQRVLVFLDILYIY